MDMSSLSVLITARNEQFLTRTVEDCLANMRGGNTNVIVNLDGPINPPVPDDPRVVKLSHPGVIGQRAGINAAARASTAKYVMKLDAHCSVDEGFDLKLMEPYEAGEIGMDTTTIPRMYNLHVFDWLCRGCGNRTYQGPRPELCEKCKAKGPDRFEMVMVWQPRRHKRTDQARFDQDLHFQYWRDAEKRAWAQGDIADVMSFVGCCFFMPLARYWELDGLDEGHSSWGQMGTEVSCKSWLSGGRMVVNKRTWFTHLFRTQPGFSFPYPNPGIGARKYSQELWMNNRWPKQTRPLSWMIEKFSPLPGWSEEIGKRALEHVTTVGAAFRAARPVPVEAPIEAPAIVKSEPSKGVVFYTDGRLGPAISEAVQNQIKRSINGHRLVSVSLKPMDFGLNRVLDMERGILTMFNQIMLGLIDCQTDIVFLAEHDILYSPSHWKFTPPDRHVYYYNTNWWKVDSVTGRCLHYYSQQTSQLCAYRELLLQHYERRIKRVEQEGYNRAMGFEPGTHQFPRGVDEYGAKSWRSKWPNIDIRHGNNLTPSRWSQDQFRSQRSCQEWEEADRVPGWPAPILGRFNEFLAEVNRGSGK
jgi:hypothetical protein